MKFILSLGLFFVLSARAQSFNENLQLFSDKTLLTTLKSQQAVSGLAIVMDLTTNKVISSSSYIKKGGLYVKDASLLTSQIEPGSLIMPMSAAMLMDNFGFTLNDSVDLEGGRTKFNGLVLADAEQHGIRNATLLRVLSESSNVGIAKLINSSFKSKPHQIDYLNKIHEYVDGNGNILVETKGLDHLPWNAIGYGFTLSPNQIFNFYNRVALSDSSLFSKSETLDQIKTALVDVCKNGTAKKLFANAKYSVAGKTGTSLVANGPRGYTDVQFQASFVGYAPANDVKYACLVIIKTRSHAANHFGASVAGPVFKSLIENALKIN